MIIVYAQICNISTESKVEDCSGIISVMPKLFIAKGNKYRHTPVKWQTLQAVLLFTLSLVPSTGPNVKQEFHKY